jgi:hypothetical protein
MFASTKKRRFAEAKRLVYARLVKIPGAESLPSHCSGSSCIAPEMKADNTDFTKRRVARGSVVIVVDWPL